MAVLDPKDPLLFLSLEQHSSLFLAALELEGEMMVNFS